MDELSEYLSKTQEPSLELVMKQMDTMLLTLSTVRKSPQFEKLCNNFLDKVYEVLEDRGIELL